jgi:hypothetical protein
MELETESLYVVVIRKETTLAIIVYRKPTHTADSNQEPPLQAKARLCVMKLVASDAISG